MQSNNSKQMIAICKSSKLNFTSFICHKISQQIFRLKNSLCLHNILLIAGLCIVIPLSNAVKEFSFSWRQLTKEAGRLGNDTLELILAFEATRAFLLRDTITRLNYFSPNTLMEQCGNVKGVSMVILTRHKKRK